MANFPTVVWGKHRLQFELRATLPEGPFFAALAFVFCEGRFVVADIEGRGWCIPGGRLEAGETPEQAVQREMQEEIGTTPERLLLLGLFQRTDTETGATDRIPAYIASIPQMGMPAPTSESRAVSSFSLEELPTHYYTWDVLLEAVFTYALRAALD